MLETKAKVFPYRSSPGLLFNGFLSLIPMSPLQPHCSSLNRTNTLLPFCLGCTFHTFLLHLIWVSAIQRGLPSYCVKNKLSNSFSLAPYPALFIFRVQSHCILWLLVCLFVTVSPQGSVSSKKARTGVHCRIPISSTVPGPLWSASTGAEDRFQSWMTCP